MVHTEPNAEAALRATAHTPGPWIAGKRSSVVGWPVVAPHAGGRLICDVTSAAPWPHGGGERAPDSDKVVAFNAESEANARLIAAAPELLDALREFFTSGDFDIQTTGDEAGTQAWIKKAHAAIAKATGR